MCFRVRLCALEEHIKLAVRQLFIHRTRRICASFVRSLVCVCVCVVQSPEGSKKSQNEFTALKEWEGGKKQRVLPPPLPTFTTVPVDHA